MYRNFIGSYRFCWRAFFTDEQELQYFEIAKIILQKILFSSNRKSTFFRNICIRGVRYFLEKFVHLVKHDCIPLRFIWDAYTQKL